ncbi:MAG: tetratricopeptide repeat protein [Archangium sp.]|nr:tetratricopeptide repeat protein [Archangium sp.]
MHPFASPAASTSSSSPTVAPAHRPCVLVVDPHASARSVLEVALARDGFDVWSTSTAADGIALLATQTPEMVVLEADLGADDGFSFVAQLRGDARTAKLPVLLLVDGSSSTAASVAEVVGVDDVLPKPAYARDIGALVRLELATKDAAGRSILHTGQVAPAHVVRALLTIRRSATVRLAQGHATLELRDGAVVAARCGAVTGLDAVVRALVLGNGEYTVEATHTPVPAEFRCELREFVHVVLARLHDWSLVAHHGGSLDARFGLDFARLAAELTSMPDEVNRVVRLFDGRRTVRDVLAEAPFSETLALEVCSRLQALGVVVPMPDGDQVLPRSAPKLFEPRPTEAYERMEQLFEAQPALIDAVLPKAKSKTAGDWVELAAANMSSTEADDGGWTTKPLAGLDAELSKQLDAFNVQTVVEPRATPEAHRPTASYARGQSTAQPSESIEQAIVLRDVVIRLENPVAVGADRQARIDTPDVTPVVRMPPDAVGTPEVNALEAAFFGPTAAELEAPVVPLPLSSNRSTVVFVAVVVGVLAVAIGVEWLSPKPPQPVPVVDVTPIATPTPELAIEAVPETVIDVTGPLADAKKLYDAGRFAEAVSVLEQVVADAPKSVPAWLLLGLAQYDANHPAAARTSVDRVLALDPSNARVQVLIATLAFDAGDTAAAKAALEKYLTLEPNGPSADEARALLAR